jgi:predicted glycoside hydrolase/deacetylase ChbG (UPF0249 family)
MKIILHADDFGFDDNTVKATIDCFEKGALNSATIMPSMPSTKKAIEYAKVNPQFSFGVHLTYVDGLEPICNANEIKSLIDKSGKFLPSNSIRLKSFLHTLNRKEIIEETKRQIGFFLDSSIPVSHVDSHGHIHKFPFFQDAICEAIDYFSIRKVRKGQDVFLNLLNSNGLKRKLLQTLNNRMDNGLVKKFISTNHLYMPTNSFDIDWSEKLLDKISMFDVQNTLEVGVHPGTDEKWRAQEYKDILLFSSILKGTSNELINWNNII